jgi:hypothetical protein
MGNPQKNSRAAEVENDGETEKLRRPELAEQTRSNAVFVPEGDDGKTSVYPCDVAGYIHDMAVELKGLADSANFSFLSYLLDLVIEESAVQKRGRL